MGMTLTLAGRLQRFSISGAVTGAAWTLRGFPLFAHPLTPIGPGEPSPLIFALVFILGGALGGALIAALFPLSRFLFGAFLLGAIGVLPAFGTVQIIDHSRDSSRGAIVLALVLTALIGGVSGTVAWFRGRGRSETPHWIFAVRYPTSRGVLDMWAATAACAVVGWVVGIHWAGQWPAMVGFAICFLPLGLALAVTVQWFHQLADGPA